MIPLTSVEPTIAPILPSSQSSYVDAAPPTSAPLTYLPTPVPPPPTSYPSFTQLNPFMQSLTPLSSFSSFGPPPPTLPPPPSHSSLSPPQYYGTNPPNGYVPIQVAFSVANLLTSQSFIYSMFNGGRPY